MTSHQERLNKQAEAVGLPFKVFLYTLEQVADMLQIQVKSFAQTHVYFDNRTPGRKRVDQMMARDVAPIGSDAPEWRIADNEVLRWFKAKGYKIVERGYVVM